MNATILFSSIQDKLPKKIGRFRKFLIKNIKSSEPIMSNEELLKKLESLSETELNEVAKILKKDKLDSPVTCFWLYNLLLGCYGVAWFRINMFSVGCMKLILLIIAFNLKEINPEISGILDLDKFIAFWCLLDLFIIGAILRNKNLEKVNNIIDLVRARNAN
ncbi:hypothetical protein AVANS14531_05730 [Campylobacter sp. Cr9]|uniref:hypothetical protein n=1 Tax=Campylobacter sp. Cr9 TaxID=2735728 RepID=UPI00301450E0|nr:hypothetical protein [Campylobacter sp. Cr9]